MRKEVETVVGQARGTLERLMKDPEISEPGGLDKLKDALVRLRFLDRQALNLDASLGALRSPPRAAGGES